VLGKVCTDDFVVVAGAERISPAGGDDLRTDSGQPPRPDGGEGQPERLQLRGMDFHRGHDRTDAHRGVFVDPGAIGASFFMNRVSWPPSRLIQKRNTYQITPLRRFAEAC